MWNRRKTLLRDHSVPEVTLKACPRHYSVSAIPETLTIQGPKRPPINGGESGHCVYEVNSSRHYKCKGLFTKEFQSILELQNHQIPKVKTGLANHCNNNWRRLSNSGQSATSFSTH